MLAALKFDTVMKRVFGSSNDRRLKGYRPKIAAIHERDTFLAEDDKRASWALA